MSGSSGVAPADLNTPKAAFLAGLRAGLGTPMLVIGIGFLGFGALCSQAGVSLGWALAATSFVWALPGQLLLIESLPAGLSLLTITLGVALANVRLMPMVAVLTPYFREGGLPRWQQWLACHLIALTTWITTVNALPRLAPAVRAHFLYGISGVLILTGLTMTFLGYLAGSLPPLVVLSLVISTPVYFLIVLVVDLSDTRRLIAIGAGLVLGPVLHEVTADWYLALAGLAGGTLAFLLRPPRRRPPPEDAATKGRAVS